MNYYRQCKLKKGDVYQTTWLPESYAKKGRPIKLRKKMGGGCVLEYTDWDNGWVVVEIGNREEERVLELKGEEHQLWKRKTLK